MEVLEILKIVNNAILDVKVEGAKDFCTLRGCSAMLTACITAIESAEEK